MALAPGTRLGPYEIRALLGEGGMGVVYRAQDTQLKREVAIKVLPEGFAQDPDRLARFQREAELLATLNHPNIAAIYGLEDSDGTRALVLELVEGPTLADRIAKGPIPIDDALPIARQIAEALEAAHERGVIHRDLKPANIKLRDDGTVKVLDFGLAKLVEAEAASKASVLSQSPTITSPVALTTAGVILGTAAYMAPEQAAGQPADKRSDIWSLGCVLFEMLTGRRVFEAPGVSETLSLVLTKDPDWTALPSATPPAIRTVLTRCLERDRRKRVGDVAAVRFVLEEAAALSSQTSTMRPRSRRAIALGVLATALIAAAAIAGYRFRAVSPAKPFTFSILPPEGTAFTTTTDGGAPALSPDGHRIAFVATGSSGRLLWVQSIDAFDARPLPGTEDAAAPFWSPDGTWLGFLAGQDLKKVNVTGGRPQVLARANAIGASTGATANREGTILFYGGRNNTLASVAAAGGEVVQATERNVALFDENHTSPVFLPDGRHYLLLVRGGPDLQSQVWVGVLGSNERRLLLRNVSNAQYAPPLGNGPGHLLFARGRNLVAQPFEARTMALSGHETTLAENITVSGNAIPDFTVSLNGVLAYRHHEPGREELAWYDRGGKPAGTIGDRPGNARNNLRVSPDGKWVAFTRMGEAFQDVWIADLVRGGISRFTFNGGRSPAWSPDGSQLAFLREDTIYRKPFTGGGAEVALWNGPGTLALNDWSGDGKYLLLTRWDTSRPALTGRSLWLLPDPLVDSGNHEPALLESDALHGQFGPKTGSPHWVSFDAFDGDTRQVFVRTMPGQAPGKWQVSTNDGNTSRWHPSGHELYFLGNRTIFAVDINQSGPFRASAPHALFVAPPALISAQGQYAHGWDVTPDGQRFLTTLPVTDTRASAITVVLNWQSALAP